MGILTQTNNGLRFSGDQMYFQTGSTNGTAPTTLMTLEDGGNLGIGTTSFSGKLSVHESGSGVYFTRNSGDNGTTGPVLAFANDSTKSIIAAAGDGIIFRTRTVGGAAFLGSEKMRITSGGNVGIGTTSPGAKLDVSGGDIRLSTNATYLRSKDSASAVPRVLGMNASNTFYIGPIDSYGGGPILYGVSSSVTTQSFYTGGSERVRITSSGNVGIGTTSPNATLTVKKLAASFEVTTTNDESNLLSYDRTNSLYKSIVMRGSNLSVNPNDAGERLSVTTSGLTSTNISGWKGTFTHQNAATNIPCIETFTSNSYPNWAIGWQHQRTTTSTYGNIAKFLSNTGSQIGIIGYNGTSGVTYGTTSDYRLKENIVAIDNAIERVANLKPCRFNFIEEKEYTQDGFIAHELAEVVPEAVTGEKDGEQMQSVDKSKVIPLLTKALQDAINKIQELEIRIQTLENN